jgi:DNA-binding MarR family transcriptional regulator
VDKLTEHEEEIANKFLLELISLTRHIENISHEDTKIGSGIFILNIIESKPESIMKDIVENLNLGASTATRQVDLLVKKGIIKRDVLETDRRKVILALTEEGKQIYQRFKNHLIHVMKRSLKEFSENEVNLAIDVFQTIVKNSESNLPLK